ncbi:MAG: T9SS type A sorting domain-containing protein [Flavobacteriales bacterium]
MSITDAAGCTSQADTTIVLAHIDEHAGWYVDITPFTHTLTIDSPFAGQVYVYDMQGRVVATLRVSVGLQSIDVSRWARGRYVVRGE